MTLHSLCHSGIVGLCSLAMIAFAAEPKPALTPLQELTGINPTQEVFKESRRNKPLVVESPEAAGKYFADGDLTKLKGQVDFKQQKLLIFAWAGSGQDQLTFTVAESYPEQIIFQYKRGLTKDLHKHVRLFALRSNVQWSTK